MIPVIVDKISYHPSSRSYAVLLKGVNEDFTVPILIGSYEAQSISLALDEISSSRPLAHDLICNIINEMNFTLVSVNITKVIDGIFYSQIIINKNNKNIIIDARPSDSISIALRCKSNILINQDIINESISSGKKIVNNNQLKKESKSELEQKLMIALEKEEYEEAAKLRDKINQC